MITLIGRDPSTRRCLEVQVEGERVSRIRQVESDTECWISPGFVDLQVNGYRGVDLNSDEVSPASLLQLTSLLAAAGTTTFLPTIITACRQSMLARVRAIAAARSRYPEVHHATPAIHLEGPNLSPFHGFRGAHPAKDIRPPSIAEFQELQTAADGAIRLVTLSPHWPDSVPFIRVLTGTGIIVALGHTHASAEQIRDAVDAGATLSTHLGNGIAAQLPRHPNPLWTQLADDRLCASLIADSVHLSADPLRVMLRAKTVARSILVSDSVALAGMPPGNYRTSVGGSVTVHPDGSIRIRDSELLAGSGIALKDAVARAPSLAGCSLGDAVHMATRAPAVLLGLRAGSLEVGAPADLLQFRWCEAPGELVLTQVLVQGQPHTPGDQPSGRPS